MRNLASWKFKMLHNWDGIEVVEVLYPNSNVTPLDLGQEFKAELVLSLGDIATDDILVEMIDGQRVNDEMLEPQDIRVLKMDKVDGDLAHYSIKFNTSLAGVFDFAFRITPKNPLLPHRMDFNLVKWA